MALYFWQPRRNWMDWDDIDSPRRVFDQLFGMEPRRHHHMGGGPYWLQQAFSGPETGMSEVFNDKEKFQVNLDVSHFSPEEIKVKMTDDRQLVIEGKHEERQDEHGFISRQFKRKYILPKNVKLDSLESNLSHEGRLTIQAPKVQEETPGEREIQINMVPKPTVKAKHQEEQNKIK